MLHLFCFVFDLQQVIKLKYIGESIYLYGGINFVRTHPEGGERLDHRRFITVRAERVKKGKTNPRQEKKSAPRNQMKLMRQR